MNILIIEDEKPAADRLKRLLREHFPDAFLHGHLDSIKSALRWFYENPVPDLIFLDIQLADGQSFKIFEEKEVLAPVIFCTAYDQFALKAFQLNSVDYLLKPIDPQDLEKAIAKFQKTRAEKTAASFDYQKIKDVLSQKNENFKERFVVKIGDKITPVFTKEIAFFYSENKGTFLQTETGKTHLLDFSLEEVENLVNPKTFFRLNRKYLATLKSIADIRSYSGSRLKIKLKDCSDNDILVSRGRVKDFREWLEGE